MSQIQASPGEQQLILQTAASHYGVPVSILEGVYALETNSGRNIATSSAGAVGAFQFLPSTAAQYHYPPTNNVDQSTFTAQANAAAHYLSDLLHAHGGSWDAALHAYSGGGYGLSQVQGKAGATPGGSESVGPAHTAITAVQNAANTVGDVGSAVGSIATLLTSAQFWIRLGEAIAALLLLYLGLHALTGNSSSVGDQAKHVRTRFIPV